MECPPPNADAKYWCHQCRCEIKPTNTFACPTCNSDFIEEIETDNAATTDHPTHFVPTFGTSQATPPPLVTDTQPQSQPQPQPQQAQPFQQFFPMPFTFGQNTGAGASPFSVHMWIPPHLQQQQQSQQQDSTQPPMHVLFNQLAPQLDAMMAQLFGGAPSTGSGSINFGDYVPDSGFDRVLSRLFEMAGNKGGRKPASQEVVNAQLTHTITQEDVEKKIDCAICQDEFALGDETMQLGCKHCFHPDCIKRWLGMSDTCPVCRCALKPETNGDK
eukprot:TRINITY_DN1475_c0_g4_i1.p1 TRINITY_DN1475_c0_g4~~TRINITY_DN1475_c0_g4_i1.p1  ORF type:complete len:273 (-),score=53.40 TRINITY_DN1475_c0_g4_i1:43-861(-)